MKRPPLRFKNSRRGAAVVEFGLAFLVFLGVVYAVMEFGRLVGSYSILAGATREATRYAAVHGSASGSAASSTDITAVVKKWAIGLDTSALTVSTTWASGNAPGGTVLVQSSYNANPFSSLILPNGFVLKSSSQMVISQ